MEIWMVNTSWVIWGDPISRHQQTSIGSITSLQAIQENCWNQFLFRNTLQFIHFLIGFVMIKHLRIDLSRQLHIRTILHIFHVCFFIPLPFMPSHLVIRSYPTPFPSSIPFVCWIVPTACSIWLLATFSWPYVPYQHRLTLSASFLSISLRE